MATVEVDVRDQIVAFKRALAPNRERVETRLRRREGSREPGRRPHSSRRRCGASRRARARLSGHPGRQGPGSGPSVDPQHRLCRGARRVPGRSRQRLVRTARRVSRDEPLRGARGREAEPRQVLSPALKAGKPQIFNVYWSKPQVMARQDARLAETRAFLDRLWKYEGVFNPDRQCTYADRARRRQPGDKTLGLSPHMDAGTVERWIDPGYQKVYEHVFAGDWRGYDPFDATHRLETHEIPSPAVCSMFRTFQGWTALTRQGPKDGTLRLIPHRRGHRLRAAARASGRRRRGRSVRGSAGPCARRQPRVAPGAHRGPGLDSGGHARRHGVLAHGHLPCRRRRARRPASTPASSTSDPRPTVRRIAPIFPNSGRRFCRGVRLLTLPPMDFEVDFKGRATA